MLFVITEKALLDIAKEHEILPLIEQLLFIQREKHPKPSKAQSERLVTQKAKGALRRCQLLYTDQLEKLEKAYVAKHGSISFTTLDPCLEEKISICKFFQL
jgi:hypothetical protein